MRHRKRGSKLGRTSAHRKALRINIAKSLFLHERIITTKAKAKETRSFVEKLITLAKKAMRYKATGDPADRARYIHYYRLALSRLQDKKMCQKLFGEGSFRETGALAERYADRPGGYTRIVQLGGSRLGIGSLGRAGEVPEINYKIGGVERKLSLIKNRLGDNAPRVVFELVGSMEEEKEDMTIVPTVSRDNVEGEAEEAPSGSEQQTSDEPESAESGATDEKPAGESEKKEADQEAPDEN